MVQPDGPLPDGSARDRAELPGTVPPVRGTPRRRSPGWRAAGIAAVTLVLVTLLAGGLFLAAVYMPLSEGSMSGPDQAYAPSSFSRTIADPFGSGTLYVYCDRPSTTFAWLVTLRNDGPLPITILGAKPGPLDVTKLPDTNAFSLVDATLLRVPDPTDTPRGTDRPADPRTAPALGPTPLPGHAELELWARYRTGNQPMVDGGRMISRSIWIRYSVLGITRTAEVPLRDGVAIEGGPGCTPAT